jgi:hypothetical protein
MDQAWSSREPLTKLTSVMAPPINALDPVASGIRDMIFKGRAPEEGRDITKKLPILGRMIESWYGDIVGNDYDGPGRFVREENKIRREKKQERYQREMDKRNPSVYPWMQ